MKTPRKSVVLLMVMVLAVVGGVLGVTRAGDEPTAKAPSLWMKQKLAATQNILSALTKEDYETIQANANSMIAVGYLEKFVRADAPGYRELMGDFEYANKSLVLAAKNRNLDGATVAFLQLNISCVNCHKIVRDVAKSK